jgi:GNAT superfamily N-acetyltransferase
MALAVARYDDPVTQQLVAQVQQEYLARYGGEDHTPVDPEEFAPPRGVFLVGTVSGVPVACGGWRAYAEAEAEIKRMYVSPEHRGRGLSRVLLDELERTATAAGFVRLRLETGDRQPEALGLYESSGWTRIKNYGIHKDEPGSICFGKELPVRR